MYPTVISTWKRRRAARRAAKKQDSDDSAAVELTIPNHFLCPISLQLMKDPVTLSTGTTYDRENIERWIDGGSITCPVTNQVLRNLEPVPNHAVRKMIQDWCVENTSHGVERIPTPRIPVSSYEVSEILSKIKPGNDVEKLRQLFSKLKESAKESDRNKRCIAANGAGAVLSEAFDGFSRKSSAAENAGLFEDILSALMVISPSLDEESARSLSNPQSVQIIVWLLRFGSLSGRRNAVLALKSILSSDQDTADDVVATEGALEALIKLIKEPICPTTTKASLLSLHYLLLPSEFPNPNPNKNAISKTLTETGLIPVLLEMLVGSDKSICEKALGVLDGICSHGDEGRENAIENALTVPLLVKKILRVSDKATEITVSILLKLANVSGEERQESVVVEALQCGAFQKVLLVLQIGCSETTKEKVSELLKKMNVYRSRVECIDSLDFKHLKRPF